MMTMSRARNASHVYTTAPDSSEAASVSPGPGIDERRQQWPRTRPRAAQRLAELRAEHDNSSGASRLT